MRHGLVLVFDKAVKNPITGDRDKVVEREAVRFNSGADLAEYFWRNCHSRHFTYEDSWRNPIDCPN